MIAIMIMVLIMMKMPNEIESRDRITALLVWQLATTASQSCLTKITKTKFEQNREEKIEKKIQGILSHLTFAFSYLPVSLYGCSERPDSNLYSPWAVPCYYQSLEQVFVPKKYPLCEGIYQAISST